MLRSTLELETLAQAHQDELAQMARRIPVGDGSPGARSRPAGPARRAVGLGLIALGERLARPSADRPAAGAGAVALGAAGARGR